MRCGKLQGREQIDVEKGAEWGVRSREAKRYIPSHEHNLLHTFPSHSWQSRFLEPLQHNYHQRQLKLLAHIAGTCVSIRTC